MGLLGWEAELASDQVVTLRVQVLVKDDLIHGLAEILVNLVEVLNGFIRALSTEVLGGLSQLEDAVGLVGIDVRNLVLRHVLNVVGILDERVSVDSVLDSLFEPTSENSRVFVVEHYEDAVESASLLGVFPVGLISFGFGQVL